ncbi:MAG: AAA family ATPase, partial [Planctomycetes bacterium]|nr:AAA family ATPase [Planctomycetota bacterium]
MYCNFLGLRCLPFEDRIDTRFLYLSATCNRLLESLEHDAHHERGVTPVFGDAGLGKTLLIRALVARLHASDHVAVVTCPRSGAVDILPEVGKGFGVTISPSEGAAQYTKRLRGQLVRNAQADHRSILIVDQFEELSEENLGAVSSLLELRNSAGPLLSVILFARPHARNKMNEPRFAALAQQYTRARTIAPLQLAETHAYIEHRLTIAGSADLGMFDEGAVILIHAASKGNPRLINQLCHATLLTAYRAEARGVSEEMASTVTTEFMQERHFAPTNLSADQTNSERATAGLPAPEPSPARQVADRSVQSPFFLTETTESMPSLSSPDYKIPGESHGLAEPQAFALTMELSDTIGRGEGLMRRLELLLTRVDAAAGSGSDDDGLAQDAEERLVELLEKAQRICDRADRTESRLSRFAEELGDQAEIVQKRIGQLMDNLQAGETLQDEIRQTIQQATAEAAATNKEIEVQKQALDKAISDARKLTSEEIETQKHALDSAISEARKLTSEEIETQKQTLDSALSEAHKRTSKEIEAQKHTLDSALSEARQRTSEEIAAQKQALDNAISDARKRETGMATQAWNDCQSKISESLEETQRVHHEMTQQTRRELQVVAEELVGKSRDAQAQAASIDKRFVAMTQEADDRIRRWREELGQVGANLNSQLASLEKTTNELEQQSETE